MNMVTDWQLEQMENERRQEVREWLEDKLGRSDEFELDEAFQHAMDKDD